MLFFLLKVISENRHFFDLTHWFFGFF